MDKNRIDGAANQAAGKIKETLGKITGNHEMEAEGVAENLKGKAQSVVGKVADDLKKKST